MSKLGRMQGTSSIIEYHWEADPRNRDSIYYQYEHHKPTCIFQYSPDSKRLTDYCWKTDRHFGKCLGKYKCADFVTTTDFAKYGSTGKPKSVETECIGKTVKETIKTQKVLKSTPKKEVPKPERKIRQYKTPTEETAIGNDSKIGKLFAEIYADLPQK